MSNAEKIEQLRRALDNHEGGNLFDHAAEEEKAKVRHRALGLLDQRARSASELRGRLLRAEFPAELVDEVLDDLQRAGLIDDKQFASEWVRQRHARRGKSSRALDRELRDKGVSAEHRAEALAQIDERDEEAMAVAVAEKKVRSIRRVPADRKEFDKYLRRVVSALARRGFTEAMSLAIGRRVLDEHLAGLAEQDDD